MKAAIQIQRIILYAILSFLTNACTKEGPIGPKGDPGPPGQNGHTNVKAYNFTVNASLWTYNNPAWYVNLSIPAITFSNNDSVAVMVYCNVAGFDWDALPFTQYGSITDYYMEYTTSPNNVQVNWIKNGSGSGSDPNTYYGVSAMKYKVVVIPPSGRVANPDLNLRDYREVKKRFGLKD